MSFESKLTQASLKDSNHEELNRAKKRRLGDFIPNFGGPSTSQNSMLQSAKETLDSYNKVNKRMEQDQFREKAQITEFKDSTQATQVSSGNPKFYKHWKVPLEDWGDGDGSIRGKKRGRQEEGDEEHTPSMCLII